jgi:polysaccharide biosynthesis protein PslH
VATILYLVHRIPYPPDKGEKARSFHTLKHLSRKHRVLLGTFVDSEADEAHVGTLSNWCADVHAVRLHPRRARVASLRGLLQGQPLTLPYYRDAGLAAWVARHAASGAVDATLVYSSCMAQYSQALPQQRVLVDFVDVDSAKWAEYAPRHRWPLSWLYGREGRQLLAWERRVAREARHSFFVTDKEAALFHELAPESRDRVSGMCMGVDADHFSPLPGRASPFGTGEEPLVFTGSMDYWPNADAVIWFATEVLPGLRRKNPALRFYIVGRNPTAAVQALAGEGVVVTGTVPDVRPYLQHAALVVAPLRLARGIQTKVLEAMAMGRPVVAAEACVRALLAEPGRDLEAAASAREFAGRIEQLMADRPRAEALGAAGRDCVIRHYEWSAHLAQLDRHLDAMLSPVRVAHPTATPLTSLRSAT